MHPSIHIQGERESNIMTSLQENIDSKNHGKGFSPSKVDRETIYWQLGLIANTIGSGAHAHFTQNDYCGLMTLIYEIADKVFPEAKEADRGCNRG